VIERFVLCTYVRVSLELIYRSLITLEEFMGFQDNMYEDSDLFSCEQRGKCH
jgi:hypothetical protein